MVAFALLVARVFDSESAGLILYFLSLILFGGTLSTLGLGSELTKTAALIAVDVPSSDHVAFLFKSFPIPVVLYLVAMALLELFKARLSASLLPLPVHLVLACASFIALNKLFCAVLQGLGEFKKSIILDQILWVALVMLLVFLQSQLYTQSLDTVFTIFFWVTLLSTIFAFLAVWLSLLRRYRTKNFQLIEIILNGINRSNTSIQLLSSAVWLSLTMSLLPLLYNFISGLKLEASDDQGLAIFQISTRLVALLSLIPIIFNFVFAPEISRKHNDKDKKGLADLFDSSRNTIFIITTIVAIVFVMFTKDILAIFGPTYASGQRIAVILIMSQLVSAYFGSNVAFLILSNKARWAAISGVVSLGISVAVFYMFEIFNNKIEPVFMILIFNLIWNWLCCEGVSRIVGINVVYAPSIRSSLRLICSIKA